MTTLFQFHKGTIRTCEPEGLEAIILNFNSIKVRLELLLLLWILIVSLNFNSIKVRLELFLYLLFMNRFNNFNSIKVRLEPLQKYKEIQNSKFQFHKGTIRTVVRFLRQLLLINFNSIKVRLERKICRTNKHNFTNFNSIKVRLEQCRPNLYRWL